MTSLSARIEKLFQSKPGRCATLLGWTNQVISIAANLGVVPLIYYRVGADTAKVWFFLLSWVAFFTLFDFGFSQCISRQITFSFGSSGRLKGREKGRFLRVGGARSIATTVASSRVLFRLVSMLILVFAVVGERTFLFAGANATGSEAHLCWYLVVLGAVLLNESRIYTTALSGILLIPWVKLTQLMQTVLQNGLIFIFLLLSPRLELLGIAILVSNLLAWLQFARLWRRRAEPALQAGRAKWSMVRQLWRASWEQGVASASAYFIFTVNPLIISYLLGMQALVVYFLPLRIATIIFTSLIEIAGPQLNFMISSYRDGHIHAMLVRFFRFAIVVSVPGFVAYLVFGLTGPWLVHTWSLGKVSTPAALCWIMALYNFLALLQTLLALFITAHGVQPFARPAVTGAILNVSLLLLLVPSLGVTGGTLATFLAQLLTSNWFMVWYSARLFREHFQVAPFRAVWREAVSSLLHDFHQVLVLLRLLPRQAR